jgi:hypothetical protein
MKMPTSEKIQSYVHSVQIAIREDLHTNGLILLASLPNLAIASRIAARSTTAGTPVKS